MKSGDNAESQMMESCPAEMNSPVEETEGTRGDLTVETEQQPAAVSGEAQHGVPNDQPSNEREPPVTFPVASPEGEAGETEEEQAVEIELDTAPVGDSDEGPPEYTRALREATPPLSYEEALATETLTPHSESTLTAEAPPSYRQLFSRVVEPVRQSHALPKHGRYVLRRQADQRRGTERGVTWLLKGNHDKATINKIILLVITLIVGGCVSIAMMVFGAANLFSCTLIPLYLIVSGLLLLLDLGFHTLIFIYGGYHDDGPPMCYRIRHYDCFAFLFFVWMFVGTFLLFIGGGCSTPLYIGALIVIVCQYAAAVVLLCLCCVYVNTRCSCL